MSTRSLGNSVNHPLAIFPLCPKQADTFLTHFHFLPSKDILIATPLSSYQFRSGRLCYSLQFIQEVKLPTLVTRPQRIFATAFTYLL